MTAKKVFVSSGLGFTFPGRAFLTRTLRPTLVGNGLEVLDQWGSEPEGTPDRAAVAARNVTLLLAADAVLAILDGPDVDSGTAAEIGFASAAGTPVVGYRTDTRAGGSPPTAVNLQVEFLINRTGGLVVNDLDSAIRLLHALLAV